MVAGGRRLPAGSCTDGVQCRRAERVECAGRPERAPRQHGKRASLRGGGDFFILDGNLTWRFHSDAVLPAGQFDIPDAQQTADPPAGRLLRFNRVGCCATHSSWQAAGSGPTLCEGYLCPRNICQPPTALAPLLRHGQLPDIDNSLHTDISR